MVVRESKTHDMHPADGGGATEACPFPAHSTSARLRALYLQYMTLRPFLIQIIKTIRINKIVLQKYVIILMKLKTL